MIYFLSKCYRSFCRFIRSALKVGFGLGARRGQVLISKLIFLQKKHQHQQTNYLCLSYLSSDVSGMISQRLNLSSHLNAGQSRFGFVLDTRYKHLKGLIGRSLILKFKAETPLSSTVSILN